MGSISSEKVKANCGGKRLVPPRSTCKKRVTADGAVLGVTHTYLWRSVRTSSAGRSGENVRAKFTRASHRPTSLRKGLGAKLWLLQAGGTCIVDFAQAAAAEDRWLWKLGGRTAAFQPRAPRARH
jgi:hypothetical protein